MELIGGYRVKFNWRDFDKFGGIRHDQTESNKTGNKSDFNLTRNLSICRP